ncbi:MAG: sulfite exporter TauE/SafE family protein [Verrucomicrobiae bacterium]|nr:sulfite exporter TauE/SafE family protein [Verrucomicrobiae bacterium]MCX7915139.1 sulfite exporter TauE/SafE family protein [Verrucomicrobiae bacterium]MDW8342986.1 sulfite exporter TauE/SafE family protein [Verrucomicrobiae bacterium]
MGYLATFLAALAWSAHCVGMCGGLAAGVTAGAAQAHELWGRQLSYHVGKIFTYVFLGALAFRLGWVLRECSWALTVVAGVLLIVVGLELMGVFRRAVRWNGWLRASPLCDAMRTVLPARSNGTAFGVGLVNGFLPCPLVYAMLAYVATLPGLVPAMTTMAVFGAGTIPALIVMGFGGGWIWRRWSGQKLSGGILLAMGAVTLLRGFDFFHAWLPGGCCH